MTTSSSQTPLNPTPETSAPVNPRERDAERELITSLTMSALAWPSSDFLVSGLSTYKTLLASHWDRGRRGYGHIPFFVVMDLLALVLYGDRAPFRSSVAAEGAQDPDLRRNLTEGAGILRQYDANLLNALLQERVWTQVREALAASTGKISLEAAARAVEILLSRLARYYPEDAVPVMEGARLRTFSFPVDVELKARAAAFLEPEGVPSDFWEVRLQALQTFLKGVLEEVRWRDLYTSSDLFELANWGVLDTEAKRMGVRQLNDTEARLNEARLPRVRLQDDLTEVNTKFEDDTTYPVGGLSGLTNRGTFDNLVRSELIYMDEGGGPGEPTLFDLRFAENELLYYMRNDGVQRRRRRTLYVIFDLGSAGAGSTYFQKAPGLPYGFGTLAQGLAVRTVRDLLAAFDADAVRVEVAYVCGNLEGKALRPVQDEADLLALVFGEEIKQGRLAIELMPGFDAEERLAGPGRGRVYALTFAFTEDKLTSWRRAFEALSYRRPPVRGFAVGMGCGEPPVQALPKKGSAALLPQAPADPAAEMRVPLMGMPWSDLGRLKNRLFQAMLVGRV